MNRISFLLLTTATVITACNLRDNSRKKVIREFISAAMKYDTSRLYQLVDTVADFRTSDKSMFLADIDYIDKQLHICSSDYSDDSIKIIPVPAANSTEYTIQFCQTEMQRDSSVQAFEILFRFRDYEKIDKIAHIELTKAFKKAIPIPAPAVN